MGKISKKKLAKIVVEVKEKAKVNQWKNTDSVISWFKSLANKERLNFISLIADLELKIFVYKCQPQ